MDSFMYKTCMCECVCVCMRACVRACVCVRVNLPLGCRIVSKTASVGAFANPTDYKNVVLDVTKKTVHVKCTVFCKFVMFMSKCSWVNVHEYVHEYVHCKSCQFEGSQFTCIFTDVFKTQRWGTVSNRVYAYLALSCIRRMLRRRFLCQCGGLNDGAEKASPQLSANYYPCINKFWMLIDVS